MGIFDNAKSILIGDKEVKSIEVDGGTIWESEPPAPSLRTVTMVCRITMGSSTTLANGYVVTLNGATKITGDSNGTAVFNDVPDGEYNVTITNNIDTTQSATITVDADHTNLDVTFS